MGNIPESQAPMTLSRYLMWRIVALSVVILAVALALALGKAQSNVAHEERGAVQVTRLLEHLGGLESGSVDTIQNHLAALQETNRSGQLRHLQLELQDDQGHVLVQPVDDASSSGLEVLYVRLLNWMHPLPPAAPTVWTLKREDGTHFRATLLIDPASEQRESFAGILGLLGIICGFAVTMMLATYVILHRALRPMRHIVTAIRAYEGDDYAHRLAPQRLKELEAMGSALNRMASAIERGQDVRRQLSAKMITLQEDERARIARELHDELGQVLTAMRADTAWLQRHAQSDPQLRAVTDDLAGNCSRMQTDVRDLLRHLRPLTNHQQTGPLPLKRMLDTLVRSWRDRPGQHTELTLQSRFDETALPLPLAVAIYRLTQEALTNAIRHAQASRVEVSVTTAADAILWEVRDDGTGMAAPDLAMHQGAGLAGMCERVWAVQGTIDIDGHGGIDGGLRIQARLPLPAGAAAAR